MEQVIPFTHQLLRMSLDHKDTVIDATAGNGLDTVFLAANCAHVHAFDIQRDALRKTEERLKDHGLANATLHLKSHEHIDEVAEGSIKAVVFNLGYLPGGDKTITTMRETTLDAIKKALSLVMEEGIVAVTLYPGHPEGNKEAEAVEAYLKALDKTRYTVLKYQFVNSKDAPYSLITKKKRKD